MNPIEQYWYLIFGFIIIGILLFYKEKSKTLEPKNKADIQLIIYIILFCILITFIQNTFFPDHLYFIFGFFIFIPILTIFILYILSKNNIVLVESRIQGEQFFEMGIIPENSGFEEKIVLNTGILVHIMNREYYDSLEHYGTMTNFNNVGDNVKHCDFFNGKMIYHPENPLLHNITFYSSQCTWIMFKKIIPDIMKTNLVLTDLVDTKIMSHINEMADNLPYAMIGVREQYKHKPFDLEKNLNDKIKELLKEKRKSLRETEEKNVPENKEGD